MASKLFVYSPEGQRLGIVQNVESSQWLKVYSDFGECNLVCGATAENAELLIEDNLLFDSEDDFACIIRFVEIDENSKKPVIKVRGVPTSERWNDRVVMGTYQITNVEESLRKIITDNRRGLSGSLAPTRGLPDNIVSQVTWGTVGSIVQKTCQDSGLGFNELFNPETGAAAFDIYKAANRTQGQPGFNGYFGLDIGNIDRVTITWDSSDYKNVAVVAGEGDGANRTVVIVSLGEQLNDARREMFVDARDLQRTYQIAVDTGEVDAQGNPVYDYEEATYTDAEYIEMLKARGVEKLLSQIKSINVKADTLDTNLVYKKDYFLGDILPIKLPKYKLTINARVSSVLTINENTGKRIKVSFSDYIIVQEGVSNG